MRRPGQSVPIFSLQVAREAQSQKSLFGTRGPLLYNCWGYGADAGYFGAEAPDAMTQSNFAP